MSVASLARKDERPDERAELRRAIAAAQKARAAVDKHHDAVERAEGVVAEAVGTLAAASAAVNTARQDHAQHIATAITGGSSPTSTGLIRAARAHERDAEDDHVAAKEALRSLQADLADLESDAAVAGRAVDAALATMMLPVAHRLLEEVRTHHVRWLAAQAAVTALGGLWDSWTEIHKRIDSTSSRSDADARFSIAARAEWETALKALRENADAPLPE
jgi:hypothetical protein